jgi:hypothetical protein
MTAYTSRQFLAYQGVDFGQQRRHFLFLLEHGGDQFFRRDVFKRLLARNVSMTLGHQAD